MADEQTPWGRPSASPPPPPPPPPAPPGYAPPGYAPPGYAPPGYAPPGYAPPGYAPPGYAAGQTPYSHYGPQESWVGGAGKAAGGITAVLYGLGMVVFAIAALAVGGSDRVAEDEQGTFAAVFFFAGVLSAGMMALGIVVCRGKVWARTTLMVLMGLATVVGIAGGGPSGFVALLLLALLVIDAATTRPKRY